MKRTAPGGPAGKLRLPHPVLEYTFAATGSHPMPNNPKTPTEPSMEEIIASISRIITEDKQPIEPVNPASEEKPDILELTEIVDEDGSIRRVMPSTENAIASPATSATTADSPVASGTAPSEAGTAPRLDASRERILSAATSGAAAAALAQLGALPRGAQRQGDLPRKGADRTLEDVVRDLLRPLLQTWLDEHLPGIVERLVREEISRVAGEAGLR